MKLDVIDLASCLVAIDSQNPGIGESAMADFIEHEIAPEVGFEVTRHELVPGRPNLVLTVDGGPSPHMALSGHLDTKPVGDARDQWLTDPLQMTIIDDMAYGLGTSDMKGSVAAMLVALERIAESGQPAQVSVLLTADEEQGSNAGAMALAECGLVEFDAIVIGEPSGIDTPWEMLALVSRGICCFEITVRTTQGHSGLSRRLGPNAVLVAADVIRTLDRLELPVAEPGSVAAMPIVNAGMLVSGGVCFGTWPGECTISCEVRLVPGMDQAQVHAAIDATIAAAVGSRGTFEVRYLDGSMGWMPAVELDPASAAVMAAQGACQKVLGAELPVQAYPGGTDATYFMGTASIPTIASLGPGWLSVAHGPNECILVEDLTRAADLYECLTQDFRRTAELAAGGAPA